MTIIEEIVIGSCLTACLLLGWIAATLDIGVEILKDIRTRLNK